MKLTQQLPRPLRPPSAPAAAGAGRRAFTLVELLLVLSMLTAVLALVAPSLSRFFRGRGLDAEAQRLVALTRYGQARAASEGVPMVLWLDAEGRSYGIEADPSYFGEDTNAVEFTLYEGLAIEVEPYRKGSLLLQERQEKRKLVSGTPAAELVKEWEPVGIEGGKVWSVRFLPDGTLGPNSPERVAIREGETEEDGEIWVSQTRDGLRYEIEKPPERNDAERQD